MSKRVDNVTFDDEQWGAVEQAAHEYGIEGNVPSVRYLTIVGLRSLGFWPPENERRDGNLPFVPDKDECSCIDTHDPKHRAILGTWHDDDCPLHISQEKTPQCY